MMLAPRVSRAVLSTIEEHQKTAPVRVVRLARVLGIKVFVESLPKGISGKLYPDSGTPQQWFISVNQGESKERQRFTVAHEIGHFLLHKDDVKNGVTDDVFYRSNLSSRQEAEANAFAADLLMPWELINKLADEGKNTGEALAEAFQVSQVAMNIRLGFPT